MNLRGFRPTPTNSPFYTTPLRSPTKLIKADEPGLHLRKVIGTTTAASNGFDCRPSTRQFAYTAGAAAVIATVDDDLKIKQQFFRARPNVGAATRGGPFPATPTPAESRSNRPLSMVREQGLGGGSPGNTVGRDWSDSPTGKSSTAKDRIKAATSVALSPNGKWLAVGETGYKPRVCVFRVEDDTSETPVATVAEHTFGVHALAFSPDSKYLASLGTVNDGFLYVWSIDERSGATTLVASNKCTTSINSMVWMGMAIVTVGLRYVKVWRLDAEVETNTQEFASILAPRQKVLGGKNILLGDMLEANFVCVLPITDSKALICAESGEICLMDELERSQTLPVIAITEFRITAATFDGHDNIRIAGAGGFTQTFRWSKLRNATPQSDRKSRRVTSSPLKTTFGNATAVTAMASFGNVLVELDSKRGIQLTNSGLGRGNDEMEGFAHQLPAHKTAVLGVQPLKCRELPDAAFFTFSGDGTIQIWDTEGASVAKLCAPVETLPEMYGLPNEVKACATLLDGTLIATGDRYGTLTILNVRTSAVLTQVRAHSAEITDINSFTKEGVHFVATAGRDRTVQLFSWADDNLDLVQTMDEHAGAVTGLLSINDGAFLLSCSTDRSIVVRQGMLRNIDDPTSVAFLIIRTIQLKSAPTSICLGMHDHTILVSATDRTVSNFNIQNGQPGFSFKCSDSEGGESAIMSKIIFAPSLNSNPTIIGVSSSDKSVRLYSEFGSLIARDWGHTEGITDVAIIAARDTKDAERQNSATLVSVAADSTVFMWDTMPSATPSPQEPQNAFDNPPVIRPLPPMGPPLRKVISHSDLNRYKRDPSPNGLRTLGQPPSPQRLRKKSSRASVTQPPKLEPVARPSTTADLSRRRQSLRPRSPSPTNSPPRNAPKKDFRRRQSVATLRSKSSEGYLTASSTTNNTGFGSMTGSTESVTRTLRAYRKKLSAVPSTDGITSETLRELERELRLTARILGEKAQKATLTNNSVDAAAMAKLLENASGKIVDLLDERIKNHVETQARKSSASSPSGGSTGSVIITNDDGVPPLPSNSSAMQIDVIAGALAKFALGER
ncbi:mitogen-activated protein kinase-binding protein 1 [Acrodontium crateriforme]|uniref:Mitogen-activated protein kinase-binding protein 1 n=1 Tax=Acrodontium crateriforme TaxID=150365 RepID=A0AAQ3MAS3_9PEZI|nr:mitogen-activated protein kinase-binding protein 1 [Acrodontium crateriforme]